MKMQEKKEIILNRMYVGGYLEDGGNIGHEIINLYKADNGKNYIYVMPYGDMAQIHNDKIECILLVRGISADVFEIIGKATGLTQLYYTNKKDLKQEQEKLSNKITYGGISLKELFANNIDENIKENQEIQYVTFEAQNVVKTKKGKRLLITCNRDKQDEDGNIIYIGEFDEKEKINFAKTSLKMYFSNTGNTAKVYEKLKKIIENKKYWGESIKQVDVNAMPALEPTFLHLIEKEYDELSFSNMIAYYLGKNKIVLKKFLKEVLDIPFEKESFFCIKREHKHIDILIENEDISIIIENKIKSGINGKKTDGTQLCKYIKEIVKERSEQNETRSNDEEILKQIKCFIVCPNYQENEINKELANIKTNNPEKNVDIEKYKLCTYKKLYDFFKDDMIGGYYKDDKYFEDFKIALEMHSRNVDDALEQIMYRRFIETIRSKTNTISFK